jgi:hypothetical protein
MIKTITIGVLFWMILALTFRVEVLEEQMSAIQQQDDVITPPDTPQLAVFRPLK